MPAWPGHNSVVQYVSFFICRLNLSTRMQKFFAQARLLEWGLCKIFQFADEAEAAHQQLH